MTKYVRRCFMRRIASVLTSLLLWSTSGLSYYPANEILSSSSTSLPIDQIFSVERGFDTTDMIEVAVQGYMPNSCYRLHKGSAYVDRVHKRILINVEGYVTRNEVCLPMITPYLEVIHLGPLEAGEYKISSILNPETRGILQIEKSQNDQQDNHLYAPVDTVELTETPMSMLETSETKQTLSLKGTYPHMLTGCMRIVDIKSYRTSNNVLIVLPISTIKDKEDCNRDDVDNYNRFHFKQDLPEPVSGKALIHVRTLSGRALNKLVDFTEIH
jgi:hypothetical protein